jgi:hypothetical protein
MPFVAGTLGCAPLANGQVGRGVEAIDALVIDLGVRRSQQIVDTPIAEAAPNVSQLDNLAAQLGVQPTGHRRMPVNITGWPHKTTRAPLRQMVLLDHLADGRPLDLWG